MENIGGFEADEAIFVKDIGFHHNTIADLQAAGFVGAFHVFPRATTRPAVLIPAEGVSLELLRVALNAALRRTELPALPARPVK